MKLAVRETELFLRNLTLRVPFRYGIATMTRVPHLVVRVAVEIDGQVQRGYAADNLPPKWFTKNPETSFAEEIEGMLQVAEQAGRLAAGLPAMPSAFAWWRALWAAQMDWARIFEIPSLLGGFGVSLIERAAVDAICRDRARPFSELLREDAFGLQLGAIHPELAGCAVREFLPSAPLQHIIVRHTVGLADPLTDADLDEAGKIDDGLPHSLEDFIRTHGLTHFKIKLGGDIDCDRERLHRLARIIEANTPEWAFTLDGNENYRAVEPFRELWESLRADPALDRFFQGLIFVEQPFHREVALSSETTRALLAWTDRPPIIIDESDADLDSLRVALAGGYAGASHKNCKGIFRGVANGCLIAQQAQREPGRAWHSSAEDLTNLGPIALPQDLAVVAALGIEHAERNGHHYFAGLSQFPDEIQTAALQNHGDLYERHPAGYPIVRVRGGGIDIGSVVAAPFGVGFEPDLSHFTPRAVWRFESL